MKKIVVSLCMCAVFCLMGPALFAEGPSSSATLAVSATIDPSISLTIGSDSSGLALTAGEGTSAATLAFGHIKAFGYSAPTGVTQVLNSSNFSVATPIDVTVVKANSESLDYALTAALNSADSTNTWTIDTTTVTDTAASIAAHGTYSSAASHTVKVQVPFSNVSGSISNTINFVATAN